MATPDPNTPGSAGVINSQAATNNSGSTIPLPKSKSQARSDNGVAKSAVSTGMPTALKQAAPKASPPGYKLVKVRKEDGTVLTVMRKMSPEELEASGQKEPAPTAAKEGVDYKIVTVRNTDGSLIRVKRPINPAEVSATKVEKQNSGNKPASANNTVTSNRADHKKSTITPKLTSSDDVQSCSSSRIGQAGGDMEKSTDVAAALAEQKEYFRERRVQKFRTTLIQSLGTVLGSSISHDAFGDNYDSHDGDHGDIDEIQEGDIIDSDEDWSDDEADINDEHHGDNNYNHRHSDSSETTFHLDKTLSSQTLVAGIAASAAAAACAPQKPAPIAASTSTTNSPNNANKEKVTYNVTIADLEASEKMDADKDLERPLRRHWTNFMFYFMASLSIVLPLLFLILSIFIYQMDYKPVNSNWSKLPEAIKVGVSAWPIVFAAVVAQVFKGYATWRVERGIKLMQLEQLIGSNSFGSAIKQPLNFRQLNTLSLILLITWCLSPLGSQALQRSYTTSSNVESDDITIYHLKTTEQNQAFSVNSSIGENPDSRASDTQFIAMQFLSSLLPVDQGETSSGTSNYMDRYLHPILYRPGDKFSPISLVGHPVVLPAPIIPSGATTTDENAPYEYIEFSAHSSFFDFNCSDWRMLKASDFLSSMPPYHWSDSKTLGLRFSNTGNKSSINHVSFASANSGADWEDGMEWEYSTIECDFRQKFISSLIICSRTAPRTNSDYTNLGTECWQDTNNVEWLSANDVQEFDYGTELEDFAEDWTKLGALVNTNKTGTSSTPIELYLASDVYQMDYSNYLVEGVNISFTWNSSIFASSFATLFNTWVDLGYCPVCQALITMNDLNNANNQMTDLGKGTNSVWGQYYPIDTPRSYAINQVYVINKAWAACYLACTVLLLLAGLASVVVESITIAPDTLGYVSTVARNSRYLHVKPTSGAMTGPQRARKLADTQVMMQDVKSNADVGKIALGLKTEKAVKLRCDRLYR